MGFSFYVEPISIDAPITVRIEYAANRYELQNSRDKSGQFTQETKRIWKKKELREQNGVNEIEFISPSVIEGTHSERVFILNDEGRIDSIWRKSGRV